MSRTEVAAILKWMAQSSHVSPSETKSVFEAHHKYLSKELETELETLNTFGDAPDKTMTAGRLMVSLTVEQFQAELKWLEKVWRQLVTARS
jgi:hypothetical protein